jgi:hypothetical protein
MRFDDEWILFGEGDEAVGNTFLPADSPGRRHLRYDVPWASLSLSADIHMKVLNNSYNRIIFEHVQWRWVLNDRLAHG